MSKTPGQALEIAAAYSLKGGTELSGTAEAFVRLADRLVARGSAHEYSLLVPAGSANPYDEFAESLIVEITSDRLTISRTGRSVFFRGTPEAMVFVAKSVLHLVGMKSAGVPPHLHLEFYEGHPFFAEESDPLVVQLVSGASRA